MMYRVNKILVAVVTLCVLLPSALVCGDNNPADIASAKAQYEESAKARPVVFIPNRGQIVDSDGNPRPDLLYSSSGGGVQLYFRKTGISYVFARVEEQPKPANTAISEATGKPMYPAEESMEEPLVSVYRMDMELEGCNTNAEVLGEEQTKEYFNYYLAHCPDGITNVHGYKRVVYKNIYDSIDLVFHSSKYGVKYDFVVRPGGDVDDIKMRYDNAESIALKAGRKLQLNTPLGKLQEEAPITYSIANGSYQPLTMNGRPVRSHFVLDGSTIGFDVEQYDHNQTLVIDPYVLWSTYMGSGVKEHIEGVTVDVPNEYSFGEPLETQRVGVTGWTVSSGFPVDAWANKRVGIYKGKTDAFLASISAEGELLWYTYFGGENFDRANAITCLNRSRYEEGTSIDGIGLSYVIVGNTRSRGGIATSNPIAQSDFGGGESDIFVVAFNNIGIRVWGTYMGGDGNDYASDIASLEGFEQEYPGFYVTGWTTNDKFPVVGTTEENIPNDWMYRQYKDAIVAHITLGGSFEWIRYFGSELDDVGMAIDIDDNGNCVVGGWTTSPAGLPNVVNALAGGVDIFAATFTPAGDVISSSYFGGNGDDYCTSIAYSRDGALMIGGYADRESCESGFYAPLQAQTAYGGGSYDGVLFKADIALSGDYPLWAALYGGDNDDRIEDIAVDYYGDIWIVGRTNSSPTTNIADGRLVGYKWNNTTDDWEILQDERLPDPSGWQKEGPRYDTFLAKLDTDGQRIWSSYYGKTGTNIGVSISSGYFYGIAVAGWTQFGGQTDIPTFNAGNLQANPDGCDGGFVMLMREFDFPTFYHEAFQSPGQHSSFPDYATIKDIATDSQRHIVAVGVSDREKFPVTAQAHQTTLQASNNGVVVKFDENGAPIWSTYYGGSVPTEGRAVAITSADEIVVGGVQTPANGGTDGYLVLFDKNGLLTGSDVLDGDNADIIINDVCIASHGAIFAFGATNYIYPEIPKPGGGEGDIDGLILKYQKSPLSLGSWTYWGGSGDDYITAGAVTPTDEIVVVGKTTSDNTSFPLCGGFSGPGQTGDTQYGDAFVSKFSCSVIACLWSRFLGGSNADEAVDIAVASDGKILVLGSTLSDDFPITTVIDGGAEVSVAYQDTRKGGRDMFISKLQSSGTEKWITYLGSSEDDTPRSIAVDKDDSFIVTGDTPGTDYPIFGTPLQSTIVSSPNFSGRCDDYYVTKFTKLNTPEWSTYFGGEYHDYGTAALTVDNGNNYILCLGVASLDGMQLYENNRRKAAYHYNDWDSQNLGSLLVKLQDNGKLWHSP